MLRCDLLFFASVLSSGDSVTPRQSQRRAAAHEYVSFYDGSSVIMPKNAARASTKNSDPALNPGLTVGSPVGSRGLSTHSRVPRQSAGGARGGRHVQDAQGLTTCLPWA